MRRILCQEVKNLRDLGGYMTLDCKVTKFNSIFRSDVPVFFNREGIIFF